MDFVGQNKGANVKRIACVQGARCLDTNFSGSIDLSTILVNIAVVFFAEATMVVVVRDASGILLVIDILVVETRTWRIIIIAVYLSLALNIVADCGDFDKGGLCVLSFRINHILKIILRVSDSVL